MSCIRLVGSNVGELSLLASTKARLSSSEECMMMLLCRWLASTGSSACKQQLGVTVETGYQSIHAVWPRSMLNHAYTAVSGLHVTGCPMVMLFVAQL